MDKISHKKDIFILKLVEPKRKAQDVISKMIIVLNNTSFDLGIYRVYCRFCKKGFNRNQALEWHTASQHSGIFFQCNIPSLETEVCGF